MNKIIPIFIFSLMFFGFVSGVVVDDEILKAFNDGADKVNVIVEKSDISNKIKILNNINIKKAIEKKDKFTAYISKEELKILTLDSKIDKIRMNFPLRIFLNESIGIIGANSTWNLKSNKINLTGTSQSVCILDTGINQTHPDFSGRILAEKCYCSVNGVPCCPNGAAEDNNATDDNGHGTHVAGIVGASGGVDGVATNIGLVIVKIMNGSGIGNSGDLESGIQWCLDNATKYNISVITASLGDNTIKYTSSNQNSCDTKASILTSKISTAFANNISVTIASGNDNWNDGITWPACISNATPISSTTKLDSISSFSDRNSLIKLFAPGGDGTLLGGINSTCITGDTDYKNGYCRKSGTSMATPMVAGAIAIINQYLSLTGQTKTPSQIEDTLYNTGFQFNESSNNFSRINIYNALLSLDVDAPNVTLISPTDNTININANQTFTCNATDWQLSNITLKIWNSTNALYYNTTSNLTGTANQTSFNVTNMSEGTYKWNCLATDNQSNSNYSISNFTLTIGGISTTLLSPTTNNYTKINDTNFSCEVYSETNSELKNITFYLWNSSGNLNYNSTKNISNFSNSTNLNFTFSNEGNYSWNCLSVNNASNKSWGENNFSIVYDITNPNLTITGSPADATSPLISRDFNFNVSDDNIKNCTLIINGTISQTNSSMNTSLEQTFTQTFTPGIYNWKINCTDFAGNTNSSSENSFTITVVPTTTSGGSSGGGGGGGGISTQASESTIPKTYNVTSSEISTGYTKKLKKDEKVNFSIFDFEGGKHLLTVNEVGTDYINLTIKSDPINIKLGIGQSTKLNLTSKNYYDLFIKLNSITNNIAELTIQLINESIEIKTTKTVVKEVVKTEVLKGKDYFWVIIVSIVILVSIVFVVIKSNSKKLKTRKTSKRKHGKKNKKKHGKIKKIKT